MSDDSPPETSPSLLGSICRTTPAPGAWDRFAALYGPAIAGWCRRRGLGAADADDVAQAVFHLLLDRLPRFRHDGRRGGFRAWLRTLTQRQVSDFLRRESRHRLAPLLDEPGDELLKGVIERDLLHVAFARVRADCDPEAWRAFAATLDGTKPGEAARALGLAPSTLYNHCHQMRKRLAEELHRLEEES